MPLRILVDLYQTGKVDRAYTVDQEHIGSVDLTGTNNSNPYLLAEVKQVSYLHVVPDAKGNGVRLYFLGERAQKKGLFMVIDPLRSDVLPEITLIVQGDYEAFFVRFGRLLLFPKNPQNEPQVLDLPYHQFVSREEMLLTLNASTQLTPSVAREYVDKMRRISCRKIN